MKYTIYLLLSLLFASSLIAQNNSRMPNEPYNNHFSYDDSMFFPKNQNVWLLDSIYNYGSTLFKKKRVLERNSSGFPLFIEYSKFDYEFNIKRIYGHESYTYPNPVDTIQYSYIFSLFDDIGNIDEKHRFTINYNEDGYYSEITENWYNEEWTNGRKTLYGDENSDSSRLEYRRDNDQEDWELYAKLYSYFSEDSLTKYKITEELRESEMLISKETITNYNSFGLPQLIIKNRYTYGNEWIKDNEYTYEYDESQNLILYEVFRWNNEIWGISFQLVYEYDENNYLSSQIELRWRPQGYWEYRNRNDYVNDDNGNVIIDYEYDNIGDSLWIYESKKEFTYNSTNQIISEIKSEYHLENEIWIKDRKENYIYENGLRTLYLIQTWDTLNSTWIESSHIIYEYDNEGRLLLALSELKDPTNQFWIPAFKSVYSYPEEDSHKASIVEKLKYKTNEGYWLSTEKKINYYNKHLTKTNELPINTFKLYPNPSSDYIIIESDIYHSQKTAYEIFDIQGRILNSGKLSPDGMIKINHLTNGQYFVTVYSPEGKALTLSFVKN